MDVCLGRWAMIARLDTRCMRRLHWRRSSTTTPKVCTCVWTSIHGTLLLFIYLSIYPFIHPTSHLRCSWVCWQYEKQRPHYQQWVCVWDAAHTRAWIHPITHSCGAQHPPHPLPSTDWQSTSIALLCWVCVCFDHKICVLWCVFRTLTHLNERMPACVYDWVMDAQAD